MNRTLAVLVAAGLAAGCSARPPVVPLVGAGADLSPLGGEWTGTYKTSSGRVRSGKLAFSLAPARDSAAGTVMLTYLTEPVTVDAQHYAVPLSATDALPVTFLRAQGGRISGQVEPYADPLCNCRLATTFVGRLNGNRIEGTFTSQQLDNNLITWGEWRVTRQPPKVIVE